MRIALQTCHLLMFAMMECSNSFDLQPYKASGPDKIPTRLSKEIAFAITPVLTLLFQASLDQACLPDDWKTANICPIFKKNDHSNPSV